MNVQSLSVVSLFDDFLAVKPPRDRSDRSSILKLREHISLCLPDILASEFSARQLLWLQGYLAERYARTQVNKLVGYVRRVFKYGVQFELLPPEYHSRLQYVEPLLLGSARENAARQDAQEEHIQLVLPYLTHIEADMLLLLYMTGMRPSEVCRMRYTSELVTSGTPWLYSPQFHKTAYKGVKREFAFGSAVQVLLRPYLVHREDVLFKNSRGNPYNTGLLGKKLRQAIVKHALPEFTLYQVRHSVGTRISQQYGRDYARAVLGHTTEEMTKRYDHSDSKKIAAIADNVPDWVRERLNTTISNNQ